MDPQTGRLIPWKELKGASGVKGFGSGVVGGSLPVPANIDDAKTLKELELWGKKKYKNIEFDFEDLHIDAVKPSLKEFDRLASQYPEVASKLKYIGGYKNHPLSKNYKMFNAEYAHASRDGARIGLNPKYYSKPREYEVSLRSDANAGWLQRHGGRIQDVMTHEFGHLVDYWIRNTTWDRPYASYLEYTSATGIGNVGDTLEKFVRMNKANKSLSRYAMTDPGEAWAEGFAFMQLGPKSTWPIYVQRQHKFLEYLGNDSSKWTQVKFLDSIRDPDIRASAVRKISKATDDIFGKAFYK